MGDAAIGTYSIATYIPALDLPANRRFMEMAKQKLGFTDPLVQMGHIGGDVIAKALEAVGGNVEDTAAFLAALRKVQFDSTLGPFRFDPQSQNVLANIYIVRAEKVGGEVQNVLVQTIPEAKDPWWLEKR